MNSLSGAREGAGKPVTIEAEVACDLRDGVTAYLNQHWIPGSPRRPALAHVLAGNGRESLKAGAGHPLFLSGVQGLALHDEADASLFIFSSIQFGCGC